MSKKNIVFYSLLCSYSNEIIELIKSKKLEKELLLINIDDNKIQLPKFIQVVPTIFLSETQTLIIDEEIVNWIENKYKEVNKTEDIGAYNNDAFSISFSNLNDEELSHNGDFFSSIDDNISIESISKSDEPPPRRSMEEYEQQRNMDIKNIFKS